MLYVLSFADIFCRKWMSCFWLVIISLLLLVDITATHRENIPSYSCDLQLQSICLCTRVGWWTTEFQNTHGGTVVGHLSAIKVGFKVVVMWSCEPLCFQSFTPVSQMNYRTLGPMPGCPLICWHFYSSHQFAEATLTNSKLMAEHLCFKTFPTSTRCLYEKNITSTLMYSTTQINLRWSARDHLGQCVVKDWLWEKHMRFPQSYTVKIPFNCIWHHRYQGNSLCISMQGRHTVNFTTHMLMFTATNNLLWLLCLCLLSNHPPISNYLELRLSDTF